VDSFIYFANIRPDHKWAFFGAWGLRVLGGVGFRQDLGQV